ncbi:MAG: YqgE/AlgH family protein [Pseudomonadota bacterium]|nr:YqgE/AlgH family protein [Pseudomonadota bacterium]
MKYDSVKGSLILSSPVGDKLGGVFKGSVIYLIEDGPNGSAGVIINRPVQKNLDAIGKALSLDESSVFTSSKLFLGGPVSIRKVSVLYSIKSEVHFSSSRKTLEDCYYGYKGLNCKFFLGYSAWGPGELYREIVKNYWYVVPAATSSIFGEINKVSEIGRNFGLRPGMVSNTCGNA